MSLKCTLPEEKDIFGDERSKIYDFISPVPRTTDRLMATGARSRPGGTITTWLKDAYISFPSGGYPEAKVIAGNGEVSTENIRRKGLVAQPILKFSSMDDLNGIVHGELEDCGNGIKRGKIYQTSEDAATKRQQEALNKLFLERDNLKKIDLKKLSFSTIRYKKKNEYMIYLDDKYTQEDNSYYEQNGNLYLCLEVNSSYPGQEIDFSNGEKYKDGDKVFFPVEEKYLYIDEDKKIAILEDGCIANIVIKLYDRICSSYNPKYLDCTIMGQYLEAYLKNFLNLQQVMKEIKDKTTTESDIDGETASNEGLELETDGEVVDDITKGEIDIKKIKEQKRQYAEHFAKMCEKSRLQDEKIKKIREQIDEDKKSSEKWKKNIKKQKKNIEYLLN